MPWVDELFEPQELKRCIRDLVALSTLPAIWKDYNSRQIADSVAAALISMLNADVIYVSVPGLRDEARGRSDAHEPGGIRRLIRSHRTHPPRCMARKPRADLRDRQPAREGNACGSRRCRWALAATPGLSRVPSIRNFRARRIGCFSELRRATQRSPSSAGTRRLSNGVMASLIERSSEFVGFARLDGTAQYLNKAGCELLGLSGIEEAQQAQHLRFPGSR